MWYAVLPSKDVKKGKILGVKRFGLDLAFFRDEKGTLSCVMDLCAHRGAALSKGKMDGDCIACPFHGIAFDGKGKAKVIPANGRKSTKDLSRFNVKSYPVREEDGIVFVWYGEKEPTEELPYFYDEDLKEMVYSEFCDHWEAHYSRVIENQLDVIHVPIVHHNTIGRGNKTLIHGPLVLETEDKIQTSANNEVDRGQEPKKPKDCEIKSTNLNFKFPNVWLNHISDKIKVLIYFAPVDDENLQGEDKLSLQVSTILDYDFFKKASLEGQEEELKNYGKEVLLDILEEHFYPSIKERIESIHVVTPLSYERRTLNFKGAISGWSFDQEKIPSLTSFREMRKATFTEIPHIFKAGQWSFSPAGIPVAILTGKLAATDVLKALGYEYQ